MFFIGKLMSLTLTNWWNKLDEEIRRLASSYTGVDYPASLTVPYTDVDVSGDMTPWQAIHKMASLGIAIEGHLLSGLTIAGKINDAEKKLGEPLPNSTHYIPKIVDEQSLLLAVVFYRSQHRFQDIQSQVNLIQNGGFGKPGIQQNKPGVAKDADHLMRKIREYCASNTAIALSARVKFANLFPGEDLGLNLFDAKNLTEQYTDFSTKLINSLLVDIEQKATYEEKYKTVLANTHTIKICLKSTEEQLESLYLYKKLQDFITKRTDYTQATFELFLGSLELKKTQPKITAHAQKIWDAAEHYAIGKKTTVEKITEGINRYTPSFLKRILHAPLNPLAYVPWMMGVHEKARLERWKEHVTTHITNNITEESTQLNKTTHMKQEDLKTASADEILKLHDTNQVFSLEINTLRKSIKNYISEINADHIIKFSNTSILGWITKQLARFKWTRILLHDNLHYLRLAEDFAHQLDTLESQQKNKVEALSDLKKSIQDNIGHVKSNSKYLLFKEKRDLAHLRFNEIVTVKKEQDNGSALEAPKLTH